MKILFLIMIGIVLSNPAWCDVSLHYELRDSAGNLSHLQISISGMAARIDKVGAENSALIFQAGHLYPLYQVNHTEQKYLRLTPEYKPYLHADKVRNPNEGIFYYPKIALKPTRNQIVVSGIKCRLVLEVINGEPAIEHCLANSVRAGLLERETRSLVRTYAILRKYHNDSWLGTGTTDEIYVSVRSRNLKNDASLVLQSVSNADIDPNYLRIPKEYKLITGTDKSSSRIHD